MDDLKQLMQHHYLRYASYVILDRAIPNVIDGLKPVQRRILHTLNQMDDGKLHKVANVTGQTMAYHPHGDAPIYEALVNLANKNYLLDQQGNFGNLLTGDPASAARYIETRLSPLARETLFNPDLTPTIPSYDGRRQEPVCFPAKIPIVLLQGAEGIAVGMSTKILPHNFNDLLEAEIAILEGKEFSVLPDFPTGGIMDASEYAKGRGKIKLRTKLEVVDDKTIVIKEICYGTTTESLTRSIDEAAKKGKIKIESINDYTSENVEIEIKLPRGQHAGDLLDALYAFTECEVTLHSQVLVIKDNLPWETTVDDILHLHIAKLQEYLKRELEIERERLLEKIFDKSLERLFIENRLYKKIENIGSYEKIHEAIADSLEPFHKDLLRVPTYDDREKLLNIPIRRISRFDLDKNQQDILAMHGRLEEIEKDLKHLKKFTISYIKDLLKKHGKHYPRLTEVQAIEQVDMRAIETRQVKIGYDAKSGFIGTKVDSDVFFECTNFDKLLLMYKDGTYVVMNIPEKHYVLHNKVPVVYAGVADRKTVIAAVYRDNKTHFCHAKRFIVSKFILDKPYEYLPENTTLELVSTDPNASIEIDFKPKPKQKVSELTFKLDQVSVKGVTAGGIRIANKEVRKVSMLKKQPKLPL